MDILDIVDSFIKNKGEKQENIENRTISKKVIEDPAKDSTQQNKVKTNIDTNSYVHLIADRLNKNIPNNRVAREFNVNVNDLPRILKDSGYRFDPFFYIWTKEKQEKLIEEAVLELNSGTTIKVYSSRYRKSNKNQLLFADELKRRIEYQGYKYDTKGKKWKSKEELKLPTSNNSKLQDLKAPIVSDKKKKIVNNKQSKEISCKELVEKLNKGIPIKRIVDETGQKFTELRILLDTNGFKYDSFFNIWINIGRKEILDKIAKEVLNKKVSLDYMAKHYNVTREELVEQLLKVGYKLRHGIELVEEKAKGTLHDKVKEKVDERVQVIDENKTLINSHESQMEQKSEEVMKTNSDIKLNDEEYKLLKEILLERKRHKEDEVEKKVFKIYISNELFDRVEEYSEANNITKSSLIEKVLEQYLNNGNKRNESHQKLIQPKIVHSSDTEENSVYLDDKFNLSSQKMNQENTDTNQINKKGLSEWDKSKEQLLINSILEGTREGRTLVSILEDVSSVIGIPYSKCHTYWYTQVPNQYREAFKKIKLEQQTNWSEEDIKMLEYIITIECANQSSNEALLIASKRLKRHIDIVRKKWLEINNKNIK